MVPYLHFRILEFPLIPNKINDNWEYLHGLETSTWVLGGYFQTQKNWRFKIKTPHELRILTRRCSFSQWGSKIELNQVALSENRLPPNFDGVSPMLSTSLSPETCPKSGMDPLCFPNVLSEIPGRFELFGQGGVHWWLESWKRSSLWICENISFTIFCSNGGVWWMKLIDSAVLEDSDSTESWVPRCSLVLKAW